METVSVEDSAFVRKHSRLVEFEARFRKSKINTSFGSVAANVIKEYAKNLNIRKVLLCNFPIIETMASYDVKENLINDTIAGVMAGVTMIPQSMAFAALSTLPPYVGLYMSFFAPLTYLIFGTSRHTAWGCVAIVSLVMADIMDKYDNSEEAKNFMLQLNHTHRHEPTNPFENQSFSVQNGFHPTLHSGDILISILTNATEKDVILETLTQRRIEVASAVTVVVGLITVIASMAGCSQLSTIMSNSLIAGFTVGVSFHIATSQIKGILGLQLERYSGTGRIVKTWIAILENISETKVAAFVISLVAMLMIYLVKKFINEKYKQKLRMPIPIELVVVIAGIVLSYFMNFIDNSEVRVIGKIPSGMPEPKFPDLSLAPHYIFDGLVIIIISYAQSLAMAKTMALEWDYGIDTKQEMTATGICSIICGCFSGYIPGGSVSISLIQSSAGGKTRVASLFSAVIVLLVILVLGPYIKYLPTCVMSAIILINLRSMFSKVLRLPDQWRASRYDCAVWIFACTVTVFLDTGMALLVSVAFSIFLVILRSLIKPVVEISRIRLDSSSVEFRSLENYECSDKFLDVKLIKIKAPVLFFNSEMFISSLFSQIGIDPVQMKISQKAMTGSKSKSNSYDRLDEKAGGNTDDYSILESLKVVSVKTIILDISEVYCVDEMGVQAFESVIREYNSVKIDVLIACVQENIFDILQSTGFWNRHGDKLFLNVSVALSSLPAIKGKYNSYANITPVSFSNGNLK